MEATTRPWCGTLLRLLSHVPSVTPGPASDTSRTRWNCCRVFRPGPGDRPGSPPHDQRPLRHPARTGVDRPGLRVDRLVTARGSVGGSRDPPPRPWRPPSRGATTGSRLRHA